jgi:phosphoserine phosphatase RsbU/P
MSLAFTSATPADKSAPSLIDRAINSIERIFGDVQERDELLTRIALLEAQNDLLRKRDITLSSHMQRHDEEQRLAARIQQDFLPKTLPSLSGVSFQALYRPAHYVSGDLYDVKRLDESHVGIYLADAVGHGTPAALLTMFMKNALQTKQITPAGYRLLDPSETLALLNAALRNADLNHASFATAVYARINCATRQVTYARGGHPTPVVLKPTGDLVEIESDGALLGVFDEGDWTHATLNLEPGDRVVFYTDGVELLFTPDGSPGQSWKSELSKRATEPTSTILSDFSQALDHHPGHPTQKDDLSIVIAEVEF